MIESGRVTHARTACLALTVAAAIVASVRMGSAADAQAPGPVAVGSTPALQPGFDPSAPDYAVACDPSTPVTLTFDASGSTRVSVNGGPGRTGHSTARVPLSAGRALSFAIDSGPDAGDYHVRCLPPDFPDYRLKIYSQPQAGWYVVSPDHWGTGTPDYTIVFDSHGAPVWWMRDSQGSPMNASLLPGAIVAWYTYLGGPFGVHSSVGYGAHTLDGKLVHTYKAHGGPTDLHELQVIPNHHAMVIRYKVRRKRVDLSKYPSGSKDSEVVDGQAQEVDRHGRLKWSWNTKDHIALSEVERWLEFGHPVHLPDGRWVRDLAHMNTIDPHGSRILVSVRYADAVYEIDRSSKRILWKLGGTHTPQSLRFVGDPYGGSSFGGQHDARLSDDGTLLTLFDNRSHRPGSPRAVLYRIDTTRRTATLLESITDPAVNVSDCCGGARLLPGGDWVIAWGHHTLMTETDPKGNRVFLLRFPDRTSYRAVPVLPGGLDPARLRAGMDAMAARRG
jgi:arylsulfotransferase ASST